MTGIPSSADKDQQQRIRSAVAQAIKRRDRYAEDRVKEMLGVLDGAADDVAKQIRRFENVVALKPWQEMRLTILKDLEKENTSLKKLVADLSLDNAILKEVSRGN